MGIAHKNFKQQKFAFTQTPSSHRFCHGGTLFQKRCGRGQRPLSCKESLHIVFKVRRDQLRSGSLRTSENFQLIHWILKRYSKKFFVKIVQVSIQGDHIHALIRTTRRSFFHHFFRVVAGQIAQRFQLEGRLKGVHQKDGSKAKVSDTPEGPEQGLEKRGLQQIRLRQEREQRRLGARLEKGRRRQRLELRRERGRGPREVNEGRALHIAKGALLEKRRGTQLWKYRPFSRVVRGWRAYKIVRDYIQLNEQEILGKIPYRKERLRGMSSSDWEVLWA